MDFKLLQFIQAIWNFGQNNYLKVLKVSLFDAQIQGNDGN